MEKAVRGLQGMQGGLASLGSAIAIVTLGIMVVIIGLGVLSRRIPFVPSIRHYEEYSGYLLVALVFLGLPASFHAGSFIRVGLVYERLPTKVRRAVDSVLPWLALCYIGLLAYFSWRLVYASLSARTIAFGTAGVPLHLPQGVLALGVTIFALYLLTVALCTLLRSGARSAGSKSS